MYPSIRRRLGWWKLLVFAPLALLLILDRDSCAQQTLDNSTLQTPQVFRFNPPHEPAPVEAAQIPQIDPESLIRIPVTVVDNGGRCSESLSARDFTLRIDGEESPIALFRPNHATSAALGILVDISQAMSFKSWHGGLVSKVPFVREALRAIIEKLDSHDNIFLAGFARRFHMLDDFSTDHGYLMERLPALMPTDQLDDFNGDGIYESMIKGITVLTHSPKACDRRALLVFTSAWDDTSTHGVEDVIAKAQFAGVTVYNVIVQGFQQEADVVWLHNSIGRIAAETGGRTFFVNAWGEGDLIQIATDSITYELDNQYLLGFSAPRSGSGVLPVELSLANHPGLQARAPSAVRIRAADLMRRASQQAEAVGGLPE
jgi:VWFA-related protein